MRNIKKTVKRFKMKNFKIKAGNRYRDKIYGEIAYVRYFRKEDGKVSIGYKNKSGEIIPYATITELRFRRDYEPALGED